MYTAKTTFLRWAHFDVTRPATSLQTQEEHVPYLVFKLNASYVLWPTAAVLQEMYFRFLIDVTYILKTHKIEMILPCTVVCWVLTNVGTLSRCKWVPTL
jgi:hypothetical protein